MSKYASLGYCKYHQTMRIPFRHFVVKPQLLACYLYRRQPYNRMLIADVAIDGIILI